MTTKQIKIMTDILDMAQKSCAKINRLAKRSGESANDLMADLIAVLEELRRDNNAATKKS